MREQALLGRVLQGVGVFWALLTLWGVVAQMGMYVLLAAACSFLSFRSGAGILQGQRLAVVAGVLLFILSALVLLTVLGTAVVTFAVWLAGGA